MNGRALNESRHLFDYETKKNAYPPVAGLAWRVSSDPSINVAGSRFFFFIWTRNLWSRGRVNIISIVHSIVYHFIYSQRWLFCIFNFRSVYLAENFFDLEPRMETRGLCFFLRGSRDADEIELVPWIINATPNKMSMSARVQARGGSEYHFYEACNSRKARVRNRAISSEDYERRIRGKLDAKLPQSTLVIIQNCFSKHRPHRNVKFFVWI